MGEGTGGGGGWVREGGLEAGRLWPLGKCNQTPHMYIVNRNPWRYRPESDTCIRVVL